MMTARNAAIAVLILVLAEGAWWGSKNRPHQTAGKPSPQQFSATLKPVLAPANAPLASAPTATGAIAASAATTSPLAAMKPHSCGRVVLKPARDPCPGSLAAPRIFFAPAIRACARSILFCNRARRARASAAETNRGRPRGRAASSRSITGVLR